MSDYSKAVGYKINIQKLTAFPYVSNENWNLKLKLNTQYNLYWQQKKIR